MHAVLTALTSSLLTAGTTALAVWLKEQRDRHDRDKERQRLLTRAREEIEVVTAWLTAYRLTSAAGDVQASLKARADLDRAYARVAESIAVSGGARERVTLLQIAATMLMIGKVQSVPGKFLRVVYYVAVSWAVLWAAVGTSETLTSITVENVTIAAFMIAGIGVLPAVACYLIAVKADRRVSRRRSLTVPPGRMAA